MTRRNALLSSLLLFVRKVFGQKQTPPDTNETWKAEIAQGIAFYKAGQYKNSVDAFGRAAALNPNDPIPHLYLGLAWQQQFIPNGREQASAVHAHDEFERAIALDATAWPPLLFMARLERDLGNFGEARRRYEQALRLDPSDANTYVALGALAMQSGVADEAIADFERALTFDPRNTPAMRFLDALYRSRGDETAAAMWRGKAEAVEKDDRLRVAEQRGRGVISPSRWPPPLAGTYQIIRDVAVFTAPPPPPPPPPPPSSIRGAGSTGAPAGWTFRHVPAPEGEPPPLLIHPTAQARMLIQKVDPAFPKNASGTVKIGIVVNKDGKVRKATFVEGDSELADAAISAVRQWTYRPTISNWEAVEVQSEVVLTAGRAQ